jgi:hypothetical protein
MMWKFLDSFYIAHNKHKKSFNIQTQKETHLSNIEKINFHARKKEKHYSTFVQLNDENQYWHEDLLLFKDDENTLIDNTSWLGSQHMDTTTTSWIWISSIFTILWK